MAETAQRDRLLPSLLDRLTDDAPESKTESRDFKVLSLRQLRQNVLRDLSWLMNATALETVSEIGDRPLLRDSVLNYGMPSLSGVCASGINLRSLQQKIREAIIAFEPRILPDSLSVQGITKDGVAAHNVLSFRIQAQLWAQPAPIELLMQTDIDLESGQTRMVEAPR